VESIEAPLKTAANIEDYGLQVRECGKFIKILSVKSRSIAHLLGFESGWCIDASGKDSVLDELTDNLETCLKEQRAKVVLNLVTRKGKKRTVVLPQDFVLSQKTGEMQLKVKEIAGFSVNLCMGMGYNILFVSEVIKGSRAAKTGIRLFDQIYAVNGVNVYSLKQFYEVLMGKGSDKVVFKIKSYDENKARTLEVARTMLLPDETQLLIEGAALKGERYVSNILDSLGKGYVEIRGAILPSKDHRATQIDHILVCCHGVFAIETKYLSGHIIGNDTCRYWKQVTPAGTERFLFNPVWQNNYHVWALERLFNSKGIKAPVFSVIVFINCTFDLRARVPVVGLEDLRQCILQYPRRVPEEAIPVIVQAIKQGRVNSFNLKNYGKERKSSG